MKSNRLKEAVVMVAACSLLLPLYAETFNNTIELRCDSPGSQYFRFRYREQLTAEPYAYFLQSTGPDVWQAKTSGNYNGMIWGIQATLTAADGSVPQADRLLFENRNISSQLSLTPDLLATCTRETQGSNVSLTFGNHQDDWDFVVARKDSILGAEGLTDDSPDWDKVAAMAFHCYWRRVALPDPPEGAGYWIHPVDFLKHKAFCVGAANGFVALCSVMGIPARVCAVPGHSVSEAYVNGKWRFVENSPNYLGYPIGTSFMPDSVEEHGPLFTYSLAEMLTDPAGYGFNSYISQPGYQGDPRNDAYVEYLLESGSHWRFYLNEAYNPYTGCRRLATLSSAHEIGLLYGGDHTTYRTMSDSDTTMWLMPPFHAKRAWKGYASAQVGQANGVRQRFFLSSLDDVSEVKSYMVIDPADAHTMPSDGGDWYYSVNGHKYYLRDHGGWSLESHPYTGAAQSLVFSIPLEALVAAPAVSRAAAPVAAKKHDLSAPAARLSGDWVVVQMPRDGAYDMVIRSLDGKVRIRMHTGESRVALPRSSFAPGAYIASLKGFGKTHSLRFVVP